MKAAVPTCRLALAAMVAVVALALTAPAGASAATDPSTPVHASAARVAQLLFVAGDRMFKHAPAIGRAVAAAVLDGELAADLRPEARLGAAAVDVSAAPGQA